jgi:hypothetical protein
MGTKSTYVEIGVNGRLGQHREQQAVHVSSQQIRGRASRTHRLSRYRREWNFSAARDLSLHERTLEPTEAFMTLSLSDTSLYRRVSLWFAGAVAIVAIALTALQPASAGAAGKPGCVDVKHNSGIATQTTYVTNHCSKTVSFVVHRAGPDSPCLHAAPGHYRSYKWSNGLNYYGTTFGCD